MKQIPKTDIIIYVTEDGLAKVEATFDQDTVWLSLDQMAELFQRDKSTISRHIKNVFLEGELIQSATVANFATVQNEGERQVERQITYYNLDVIISVGYRVKSVRGTQFRIWATGILKEYMKKGFAIDDDRLKGIAGGNYWKELLDRIRDIRSSEKVLYRQVLDLYATSVDYNPHSEDSMRFFKIVQNKLHFAAHGNTAAEVIWKRADADKLFMGLTSFPNELPALKDIGIAKNYLQENELRVLNNLVSSYFDLAEINAIEHKKMYMRDYVNQLDAVLTSGNREILKDSGTISHIQAVEKAYIDTIKVLEKETKKKL